MCSTAVISQVSKIVHERSVRGSGGGTITMLNIAGIEQNHTEETKTSVNMVEEVRTVLN